MLLTWKRETVLFAVIVLLFSLLVACSSEPAGSPGASGDDNGGTYIIGDEQGDWGYPSPFAAYPRGPGYLRMSYLFDNLVWKDGDGFVGALAEDWEFDKEKLSYTFKLREGVEWHDGKPFSAGDVSFTFRYLQEQPFPWHDLEVVDQVEELDHHKVRIYLDEPCTAFINNVAGVVPILPEHIWKDIENPEEFTEPEALTGTGPFHLEEYRREQGLYRYEANPDYYLGKPSVERLVMKKISDPKLALQQGDVNYAQVQPEAVSNLEEGGFEVLQGLHDWSLKLMINHREYPLDKKDFRHALAKALDLDKLVERTLRGHGLSGSPGLVSPDSLWYCDELPDYAYHPDRARDLLWEHGFTKENGTILDPEGQPVTLEILARDDYAREAEVIGGQLQELGLEINVRSADGSVVDQQVREWNFDLVVSGHGGVGGDPEGVQNFMVGEASPHLNARLEDEKLQDLFEIQSQALDREERKEAVCKIQKIHAQELPAYPLYYPTWYYGHDGRIDWFLTKDGMAMGIPMPLNQLALVE